MNFVNFVFSEVYTGKLSFVWTEFIQTCYFCGTKNVPFIIMTKNVGHILSYFSCGIENNKSPVIIQGFYFPNIFF